MVAFEELVAQGAAQNLPLALALVYAFNRIEQKLDKISAAVATWGKGNIGGSP